MMIETANNPASDLQHIFVARPFIAAAPGCLTGAQPRRWLAPFAGLPERSFVDAIAAGAVRNRCISFLHWLVVERMMMLLNVGVPTSAIQLIVCVLPIDAIDRSDTPRVDPGAVEGGSRD
jgi:hypothetical protein